MKKRVTAIVEKGSDGLYSCSMPTISEKYGIAGYGNTAKEAKDDMLEAYEETKVIAHENGDEIEDVEIVFQYDMQAYFNYFSYLNVSEIARIAGINASQLRQYTSGCVLASEAQYNKVRKAIKEVKEELEMAVL